MGGKCFRETFYFLKTSELSYSSDFPSSTPSPTSRIPLKLPEGTAHVKFPPKKTVSKKPRKRKKVKGNYLSPTSPPPTSEKEKPVESAKISRSSLKKKKALEINVLKEYKVLQKKTLNMFLKSTSISMSAKREKKTSKKAPKSLNKNSQYEPNSSKEDCESLCSWITEDGLDENIKIKEENSSNISIDTDQKANKNEKISDNFIKKLSIEINNEVHKCNRHNKYIKPFCNEVKKRIQDIIQTTFPRIILYSSSRT